MSQLNYKVAWKGDSKLLNPIQWIWEEIAKAVNFLAVNCAAQRNQRTLSANTDITDDMAGTTLLCDGTNTMTLPDAEGRLGMRFFFIDINVGSTVIAGTPTINNMLTWSSFGGQFGYVEVEAIVDNLGVSQWCVVRKS